MEDKYIPPINSKLSIWLDYIKKIHFKKVDLNLERILILAKKLDLLKPAPLIITVGGTNGKGTTCCLLAKILLANNLKVGLYSSPHLVHYTERISINGQELADTDHIKSLSLIDSKRGTISLSYFEFSTLSALQLFKNYELDVVILEVGLGGRLDATNIVDTDISVITNISLDHCDLLGLNRDSIAVEKGGILRCNKPGIIGDYNRPITLDKIALDIGAKLFIHNRDWWFCQEDNQWNWWSYNRKIFGLPLPLLSIPLENAAIVLAIIENMPISISENAIHYGLNHAKLPGRFHIINEHPLIILDVAHNPHAANYLAHKLILELNARSNIGVVRAIVGMLLDKDIQGTLLCLNNLVKFWYCATLHGSRGATATKLAKIIKSYNQNTDININIFDNVIDAFYKAIEEANNDDCILVFGSFNTVGSVIRLLKDHQNKIFL